jgi:hypothetical protein
MKKRRFAEIAEPKLILGAERRCDNDEDDDEDELMFRVRWVGGDETWQPVKAFYEDCPLLVEEFMAKLTKEGSRQSILLSKQISSTIKDFSQERTYTKQGKDQLFCSVHNGFHSKDDFSAAQKKVADSKRKCLHRLFWDNPALTAPSDLDQLQDDDGDEAQELVGGCSAEDEEEAKRIQRLGHSVRRRRMPPSPAPAPEVKKYRKLVQEDEDDDDDTILQSEPEPEPLYVCCVCHSRMVLGSRLVVE